jgi:hypothetical protein
VTWRISGGAGEMVDANWHGMTSDWWPGGKT